MRACVQRVSEASVTLRQTGEITGHIGRGLLILLGVGVSDSEDQARLLARKVAHLRIFDDENGQMNLEAADVGGAALVVSQFTLFADCRRGKRPGFTEAAGCEKAEQLYRFFLREIERNGLTAAEGRFRTDMAVQLVNDGPVTIWLDTDFLEKNGSNQNAPER